jgi:hypothetical protein
LPFNIKRPALFSMSVVGIIANPASGKDIRRLVAHASVFDNQEKVNIVRRVLLGLDAVGVNRVIIMPDYFGIGERALHNLRLGLKAEILDQPLENNDDDSTRAARDMRERGARVIVTLGGDGTNRAVAKESSDVPLVAISTGTNNVFPRFIEGTVAGMAAGLVAEGVVGDAVIARAPRLEIRKNGALADIALVDAVVYSALSTGTRAIWDPAGLEQIVLTRAEPLSIGLSAIGSALGVGPGEGEGLAITVGDGETRVLAPIAPGLIRRIPIRAHRILRPGDVVEVDARSGVLALDGERTHVLLGGDRYAVRFSLDGPRVIDVFAVMRDASGLGYFVDAGRP